MITESLEFIGTQESLMFVTQEYRMKDYTQNGRIKIMATQEPFMRPTFEQWIKEMRINHTVWLTDPEGRERSEKIMSDVGIKLDDRTIWEKLGGEEY